MDWYTDWFNISMPLSKCDLLAIPDFAAGLVYEYYFLVGSQKITGFAMHIAMFFAIYFSIYV